MSDLCIKCDERPVFIKKRQLCSRCYQRAYLGLIKKEKTWEPVSRVGKADRRIRREMEFVKNYFIHKNWIHQPGLFRLNGENYSPDFYDGERNVFIEVIGSRQAFHQNKEKYEKMRIFFPKINFEVRTPDGAEIEIGDNLRVVWPSEVNG